MNNPVETVSMGKIEVSLHKAIVQDEIEVVSELISQGADVNSDDYAGDTPLHLAVKAENENIVKLLLQVEGISVNAKDAEDGSSPVHLAVESNNVNILKLLLKVDKLNVNARNRDKETPLHLAVQSGSVEILKLLLKTNNIDVNVSNENKKTPLHLSVESKNLDVLKILLETRNVDVNAEDKNGYTPLHLAIKLQNINAVKEFLKKKDVDLDANVHGSHHRQLHLAVENENIDILKLLLETNRFDLGQEDYYDFTPLHLAAELGKVNILKILLNAGANLMVINDDNNVPIEHLMIKLCEAPNIKSKKEYYRCLNLILEYTDINLEGDYGNVIADIFYSITNNKKSSPHKITLQHVAKLKALSYKIDFDILDAISSDVFLQNYFTECEQELARAKETKLHNCWVTFFNLLVDSKSKIVKYAGNQDLIQDFEKNVKKFPIYGNAMKSNVSKGINRRKLWDYAADLLSYNLPIFNPTHLIIRDILDNLKKKDWKNLCKKNYSVDKEREFC